MEIQDYIRSEEKRIAKIVKDNPIHFEYIGKGKYRQPLCCTCKKTGGVRQYRVHYIHEDCAESCFKL